MRISRFLPARPDRKQTLCDQGLHFSRGGKAGQELPCNVSGKSGVHAIGMLALGLRKNGMEAKQGSEMIKRHSGKDPLFDEWTLFGMKMGQRKGVF